MQNHFTGNTLIADAGRAETPPPGGGQSRVGQQHVAGRGMALQFRKIHISGFGHVDFYVDWRIFLQRAPLLLRQNGLHSMDRLWRNKRLRLLLDPTEERNAADDAAEGRTRNRLGHD